MVSAASTFKAGAKRLQVYFVDDDGYPMGTETDPNDVALPTTTHALNVLGYVSMTPANRELETATDKADGKNYGDLDMGINTYGTVEITLSQRMEQFFNYIRGAAADNTLSDEMYFTSANNTSIAPRNMGMIVSDRVRDELTGVIQYEHTIYNKGTFVVTGEAEGSQSGGDNPSPLTVQFRPVPSTRITATGLLYSATDLAVEEDTDTHTVIRSRYQLAQTTWVRDGTATGFSTAYKPLFSDVTIGGANIFTNEGVHVVATSFDTTTKAVVMPAAGTAGHRVSVLYPTNFNA